MVNYKNRREFTEKVGGKEARKIKARREKDRSIWFGLGTMGTIGWSVAIPTLIGVALGIWIDDNYPGRVSWTLTFLFLGLVLGCWNAYYWVKREQSRIAGEQNNE